jgi:hypothetical protein
MAIGDIQTVNHLAVKKAGEPIDALLEQSLVAK